MTREHGLLGLPLFTTPLFHIRGCLWLASPASPSSPSRSRAPLVCPLCALQHDGSAVAGLVLPCALRPPGSEPDPDVADGAGQEDGDERAARADRVCGYTHNPR